MTAYEVFTAALDACPYPATQIPVTGDGPIYVSWTEIRGTVARSASNQPVVLQHVVQVDIWSRKAVCPELYPVLRVLWRNGIHVDSWGPLMYEEDTFWFHMPITCRINERFDPNSDD